MRCLSCHYDLRNLTGHRCPECGRGFDPNDPSTLAGQPFQWGWFLFRTASGYVILLLLFMLLRSDHVPPWQKSEFPIVAIFVVVPVAIGNLLTIKYSWFGWLMALLFAGLVLVSFMPALAR